ncbi:hypothetical protein PEX2_047840 [Penicillium expansum]|uniref:Uncharacterized protein n=1 Tax=Penicillium expansum TaxID=27334 RepID=A0A0A2JKR2_PENEN|nr:hypothetical protein PEX2_047840 [Penicillium expansum]KGO52885.1 hypothetical protein PEX2_047840 [Penicillium expansum]
MTFGVLEWSGWLDQGQHESSQEPQPNLIAFANSPRTNGRRDYNKAVKTALAMACQVMRVDAKTLVLLHAESYPTPNQYYGSRLQSSKDETVLLTPGSYSGYGPAQVLVILNKFMGTGKANCFSWEESEDITKVKLTADVMKEYVPKKTATIPDFAEEITSIINSVPEREMYPCIFHDPTLSFHNKEYGTTDAYNRPISHLTRSELLHIGRCCNPDVLRQFGAILTKLIVVVSAREMPDHISSISADYVAKIPLVLASERYNRQFWKLLLHTIEPGTKLSAQPAALLAALSLRLGIVPLMKVSEQEMLGF